MGNRPRGCLNRRGKLVNTLHNSEVSDGKRDDRLRYVQLPITDQETGGYRVIWKGGTPRVRLVPGGESLRSLSTCLLVSVDHLNKVGAGAA